MAKRKKEFSKEAMYKKIMPSMFNDANEKNLIEDKDNNKLQSKKHADGSNKIKSNISSISNKILSELQEINGHNENDIVSEEVNNSNSIEQAEDEGSIRYYIGKKDDISYVSIGLKSREEPNKEMKEITIYNKNKELEETTEELKKNIIEEENFENQTILDIEDESIIEENNNLDAVDNIDENVSKQEVEEAILQVNIYELMIQEKIDNILGRFQISDSLIKKQDIVNMVLKKCPEYYFEGTEEKVNQEVEKEKNKKSVDIILEIIKVIMDINKKNKDD
ncbi:hypothetical protein JYG23_07480 [Sedimentibacter sp. zth1]|uniref:hypothetical protein n=1 Tax=Sedimentibacter sp. zth1 TaxID=2816908 RepID=UPI001A919EA1|nr:hypothetical protein [Sedimentibacter sp. zth1]QSX07177.1 hypothetical protein JYG23_07480 [Sedimentibacter sp. zth1]